VQIAWRGGLLQCVPDPGMDQVAALCFPEGVLDARNLQIKRMIIGESHQVEAEGLQRVKRFGRGEEPAIVRRLLLFYHCRFKIRKYHVALQ
jgi:hypothetical protein